MTGKKTGTQENHRSAVTGRFVTERYADTHPRTTVTERGPKLPTPPSGGKKK